MRLGRNSLLLSAFILSVMALPAGAARTAFRYDTAQRVVKACVLGIGAQTADTHPNPYVMEGLRRSELTPDDWVFENPLAPATVVTGDTPADYVVKGKRDYWFVPLTDETARRLVGMDLIYICAPVLNLSYYQHEGLRAAVEAGAVLWVDNDVAEGGTVWTNFPWHFEFTDPGVGQYVRIPLDGRHGLLSKPHDLSGWSVALLGDDPDMADYQDPGWNREISGQFVTNLESIFRTVVQVGEIGADGQITNRRPFVVAGQYGSGSIVVTAGGVGFDVGEWIGPGGAATGFVGGRLPAPNAMQAPDVKLGLNMVQWNDRWEQARRSPRAAASTVARAPLPLDLKWQFPEPTDDPAARHLNAVVSTPVHARGMVYAISVPSATAPASVVCLDTDPEQSLDGDRFPDDGIGDYGGGSGYDVVWGHSLPTGFTPRFAGPALASIPVTGTGGYEVPIQVVLVAYVDPTASPNLGYVSCINATVDPEIRRQVPAPFDTPGALLWTRELPGYGGTADVVALSTPVVHNGFVYVLADEYDALLPGSVNERAYGRVHCFQLDFDWSTGNPNNAGWWVYPSSDPDLDGDGSGTAVEEQRSLPPFHNPTWVVDPSRSPLPPRPGSVPVVHAAGGAVDGGAPDALVTFSTPVTFEWGAGHPVISSAVGGSVWCLVPAPLRRADRAVLLNSRYFLVRVNQPMLDTATANTTLAINSAIPIADRYYNDRFRIYEPGTVREAIATAVTNGANPLAVQLGVDVLVDYDLVAGGSVTDEAQQIPGPVRWRTPLPVGQSIAQPPAMGLDDVVVSGSPPIVYPPTAPPTADGGCTRLNAAAGGIEWSYDPRIPPAPAPTDPPVRTGSVTGPALTQDTAVIGASAVDYVNAEVRSSVLGLSRPTEVRVRLGRPPFNDAHHLSPSEATPTRVTLLGSGAVISRNSYRLDRWSRDLIFPGDRAGHVMSVTGARLGPIYGQTIIVDFMGDNGTPDDVTDDTAWTELHYVPDLERFQHTYGFLQLRRRPVNVSASVVITRPDGTPIDPATYGPAAAPVSWGGYQLMLDGWIDISSAVDAYGDPVAPGDELLVGYTGWDEARGGFISIPDPTWNLPAERHSVAEQFGPSVSSPVIAGDAIHLGTQGLDIDLDAVYEAPEGRTEADTMLSLLWNRATGFVRSSLMQPAVPQPGVPGIPVVMSSPSVGEDRVYVGTRMMTAPDSTDDVDHGYVSALGPWRVLLTDTERVVETTGSEPSWVCTGTSAPQRGQSFVGEDVRRPFSRPAKATRLQTGNILVVDTGNNRVVEIDRAGRLVWPLDLFGFEYYTSPDNHELTLSRPADAYRYYATEEVDTGGGVRTFPVLHTVVADTGNARVIDIVTRFYDPVTYAQDGRQRHTVVRLTPTYVRVGSSPRGYERVRYTSAQPIFDPVNNALIGYLCAASNLNQVLVVEAGTQTVNPRDTVYTPNNTIGQRWRYWAWLYDHDPTDADHVSNEPLQFENIKHVEYARYGSRIYVTVTCTRYFGRAGDGPHPLAAAGPGVFEFIIDVSDPNPDNWGLDRMGTGGAWPTDRPHWRYTAEDYHTSPMTELTTATGTIYRTQWYPVCARRLRSGDHLIVNSLSMIESATPHNIGGGARNTVLGSHIFQVATTLNVPEDPNDDIYTLDPERSVPRPGEMWADPFTQPTYAEVN